MDATHPEVHIGRPPLDDGQAELPLSTQGVIRYVWHGRFGAMLIEAREGVAYVNGEPVHPASRNFAAGPRN